MISQLNGSQLAETTRPQSTDTSARASCGVPIYIPAASITCKITEATNLHNAAAFLLADKFMAMSMQVGHLPLHHNAVNWVLTWIGYIIQHYEHYEELK